jgi:hypothetical protein
MPNQTNLNDPMTTLRWAQAAEASRRWSQRRHDDQLRRKATRRVEYIGAIQGALFGLALVGLSYAAKLVF